MQKTIFRVLLLAMFPFALHAQLTLGNQRDKFSLSATIDAVPNTDYTWDEKHKDNIADGRMKQGMNVRLRSSINLWSNRMFGVSIAPFYNYSSTRLQTDWRGTPMFDFPEDNHHYGATLTASMNMLLCHKPMTLMITTSDGYTLKQLITEKNAENRHFNYGNTYRVFDSNGYLKVDIYPIY